MLLSVWFESRHVQSPARKTAHHLWSTRQEKGDCDECLLCRTSLYIACNTYILGSLLELVLELSEADRRQNDDISELIATILATNEKISVLNQSIAVLKGGNGNLSLKSAEEIVIGRNDVNGQQTTGATSPATKGRMSRDMTETTSDMAATGGDSCDDISAKETTELVETEADEAKDGKKGAMDPYRAENTLVEDLLESGEATQLKDWTENDMSSQQITGKSL